VIDDGKNKTRKGYIWVVRDPIGGNVFFHYDHGSRSNETARLLLSSFNGAIQSDGYYEKLTIM
ncbi:MAG: IS66 family transposase, partial [Massilibacteroides sp.]|nr:IS66 family transposase [Massilibacteroides sp.]